MKYHGPIVIKFYLPGCPLCQAFRPFYDDIALASADWGGVTIAAFDCSQNKLWCIEVANINQTPTIRYLRPGDKLNTKGQDYLLPAEFSDDTVENFHEWLGKVI